MEISGSIFDIKRFAVHDGPGIRTTVFLKGCLLSCEWCHNPEGIHRQAELVYFESRCIHCGACVEACPNQAREIIAGEMVYHPERCEMCARCLEACYAGAIFQYGQETNVEEVMAVLRQDAEFYRASGGGVTLSGGEPLAQERFSIALLRQCKAEGFHTAIDTSGQVPWTVFESVLPYTDLVLFDLKHLDPQEHRRYTGLGNTLILDNLRHLDRSGVKLEIRIPLVPGVNDGSNLDAARAFLGSLGSRPRVRLLPYHPLAGGKYLRLGREYRLSSTASPDAAQMQAAAEALRASGCEVVIA
jgi:pyruvate formate lyase activating enzyme